MRRTIAWLALIVAPSCGFVTPAAPRTSLGATRAAIARAKPPLQLNAASASGGSGQEKKRNRLRLPPVPGSEQLKRVTRRLRSSKLAAVLVKLRPLLPFLFVFVLVIGQAMRRASAMPKPVELSYAAFMHLVESKASAATISDMRISLTRITFLLDGRLHFTRPVRAPQELIWFLHRHGLDFRAAATSAAASLLPLLFPCIWLAAVWSMMRKQMGGATGNVGKKGSSMRLSADDLTFDDVAGIDTAKVEVQEIVSMLRDPRRYEAAGARLPSGVLMVGPPGTGKTLLARVMAAQADVPFFYCSGSDFVELFVGRGAARMRALFKEAVESAPCLIFVDELDALGKQRSLRISGSNDEVEQTLNQMLACMDGVDSSNNGVVVMGATNRYEILDPALTRPGRFDRLVRIELPSERGRAAILRVHTRKLQLAPSVNLAAIAEATPAYSGAELAALANEAAIRAVRRSSSELTQADFLAAIETFNSSRRRLPSVESLIPSELKKQQWWPGGPGSDGGKGGSTA